MGAPGIYLGMILALAVVLAAFFAWRRAAPRVTYLTLADTGTVAVAKQLGADLGALETAAKAVLAMGAVDTGGSGCPGAHSPVGKVPAAHSPQGNVTGAAAPLVDVGQLMGAFRGALPFIERLRQELGAAAPTTANLFAIYNGLNAGLPGFGPARRGDTKNSPLAAEGLGAGHVSSLLLGACRPGTDPARLGEAMLSFARALARVDRGVHTLGSALGVE